MKSMIDSPGIFISRDGGATSSDGSNIVFSPDITASGECTFTFSHDQDDSEDDFDKSTTTALKLLFEDGKIMESPLPPQDQWQLEDEFKWEKWQVSADEGESYCTDDSESLYKLQVVLNDSDGDWTDDFIVQHEQGLCWLMDFLPALFKYESTPVCHIIGAKVYKRI